MIAEALPPTHRHPPAPYVTSELMPMDATDGRIHPEFRDVSRHRHLRCIATLRSLHTAPGRSCRLAVLTNDQGPARHMQWHSATKR